MSGKAGRYTIFSTDLGWMGAVTTDRGVFASVLPQEDRETARTGLLSRLPFSPIFSPDELAELQGKLAAFLKGEVSAITAEIDWSWATPFQKKILSIVCDIPAGATLSYGEVAAMAGIPGAPRAVGRALASNRIPLIIPCHRVIRKNGGLGGYTGACLSLKSRLLAMEDNWRKLQQERKQGT